jgi:hypothetical protein
MKLIHFSVARAPFTQNGGYACTGQVVKSIGKTE